MRYSQAYLEEVVETQGELFDAFARRHPNFSTDNFITAYMNSQTRLAIDAGQAYVCTMDFDALTRRFLSEGYEPMPGSALRGFLPNWIGRFYALGQWMLDIPSRKMVKRFPLEFLKTAYPGLHDLDLDLAVKKAAGVGL